MRCNDDASRYRRFSACCETREQFPGITIGEMQVDRIEVVITAGNKFERARDRSRLVDLQLPWVEKTSENMREVTIVFNDERSAMIGTHEKDTARKMPCEAGKA